MKFYKPGEGRAILITGTCLQGEINIPYYRLIDTFGEPTGNDGYKTDAEWDLVFEDDTVATIYNYKDGKNYLGDDGMDDEYNDGVRPPKPVKVHYADIAGNYPRAALYIKAEAYSDASHYAKVAAGKKAMDLIEDGGDLSEAESILNNWLPKEAIWD